MLLKLKHWLHILRFIFALNVACISWLIIDLFLVSCACHQWFCTSSLRCWIFFRQAPKICQSGRTRIRTFWSPALRTSPFPPSQILTNTLSLPALIAPQHPPNWTTAPAEVTLSSSLRLCTKRISSFKYILCISLYGRISCLLDWSLHWWTV